MENMINPEKLEELRDKKLISEEEYNAQKKHLFEKIIRKENGRINPKNGIVYVLLAWFLGTLGIHNFYAGYVFRGVVQLLMTLTAQFFMFIPLLITAVWAYLELLLQNKSRDGERLGGSRKVIFVLRTAATIWLALALFTASYVELPTPLILDTEQGDFLENGSFD